jgi:hypothetical protein
MSPLDFVLDGLMRRYTERVPDVHTVVSALVEHELVETPSDIKNDHIAFRTMGVPLLGIQSLERLFLGYGYTKEDAYTFPMKKLDAFWYSPPEPHYPRLFISELRVDELPRSIRDIIYRYTSQVIQDPTRHLDLNAPEEVDAFLHTPLWTTPTWEEYSAVLSESEYAAWVLYNRYYLNHFTISVQALPPAVNSIPRFNTFAESLGLKLNDSGGKIKVSRDGLLVQSSTVSKLISATFPHEDGSSQDHLISGSYVEFAQRKLDPATGKPREGFDSGNADSIFESTYSSQINKEK